MRSAQAQSLLVVVRSVAVLVLTVVLTLSTAGHAEETVADVDEAQPAEAVDRGADEEEAEEAARRQEEADDAAARRAIVTIADTDESVAEETADLNAEKERDMNTVGQGGWVVSYLANSFD